MMVRGHTPAKKATTSKGGKGSAKRGCSDLGGPKRPIGTDRTIDANSRDNQQRALDNPEQHGDQAEDGAEAGHER